MLGDILTSAESTLFAYRNFPSEHATSVQRLPDVLKTFVTFG